MIKAGWDMWAPQLMNDCYKIYDDFGYQIFIATYPMNIPEEIQNLRSKQERGEAFAKLPEEEQRRIAREYVHRVNKIGKPSSYSFYAFHWLTPAVREELYVESRKIFSGEIDRPYFGGRLSEYSAEPSPRRTVTAKRFRRNTVCQPKP